MKLVVVTVVAGLCAGASADVIADWAAAPNGASIPASNVAAGLSGQDLVRGSGLGQATGGTFNSNGWDGPTSAADALAAGNYLQWGVSGFNSGSVTDVEIRVDVSGTGPDMYEIFASTDGFASSTSVYSYATVDDQGVDHAFATPTLTGLTGDVQFRLAAWGASSSAGTLDIETIDFANGGTYGIRLNGTVPAPGAAALLALGGLTATRRRRA